MKKINIFNMYIKIIISIFMIVLFTQNIYCVKASNGTSLSPGGIIEQGRGFINAGKEQIDEGQLEETVFDNLKVVGQVLVSIGAVVAVCVTAIMAIKWITATPDKQAKLKSQLIGLVVSIVVIFGAVGIWNLARNIMEKLSL